MTPYLICKFEKQTLTNLIKESFNSHFPDIFHKQQIDFIFRYLNDLGCESVLLEYDYLDKDYLEDYTRYYVKGFNNNGYKTTRLHFFSRKLTHTFVDSYLLNGSTKSQSKKLNDAYLGFLVVKPLPKTFIGKTCLKPYPSLLNSNNKKTLLRNYTVDLFGINLSVRTIAFQEQDKIVAACAATAIWSSLHAIRSINTRSIPSCSEITTNAINHINGSNNSFPNKELTNKQILRAIDIEHLKHHVIKIDGMSDTEFHNVVKIHIDSCIPLIIGSDVYSIDKTQTLKKQAGHAVSVLGYKENKNNAIYIHDDRLGPFARASYQNLDIYQDAQDKNVSWGLTLQGKTDEKDWLLPHEILIPNILISLANQKIRIPYDFSDNTCKLIVAIYKQWLQELSKEKGVTIGPIISYSLRLMEISEIRREYLKISIPASDFEDDTKRKRLKFLTGNYARFQWVASFTLLDNVAFDILFDATDIPQGEAVSAIIYKDMASSRAILDYFTSVFNIDSLPLILKNQQNSLESNNFFPSFINKLKNNKDDFSKYLDSEYGEPRAPSYLKAEEFNGGKIFNNTTSKKYYGRTADKLKIITKKLKNNDDKSFLIWAITEDGALVIGEELNNQGHPCLTGFRPARIAGEILIRNKSFVINSKSGRYSGDYQYREKLLKNAIKKFKEVFPDRGLKIEILPFP